LTDGLQAARPTSISDDNVEKLRALVRNNRRITARMTDELNNKKDGARPILMNFWYKRIRVNVMLQVFDKEDFRKK
jgi:hypothetical protein